MFKSIACAGVVLAAAVATSSAADLVSKGPAAAPTPAPFFLFSDTSISLSYQSNAREPGLGPLVNNKGLRVTKGVMTITHFDVWAYGTNFVNIDFLKSDSTDPSNTGTDGALEVYGFYRGTLSGNALTGSKAFAFGGIVKDVSIGFGFDANTKNTTFAPQKRDIVVGPTVAFDVPGVLNVSLFAYKEWNHCGIPNPGGCVINQVEFDWAPKIESNYMFPLTFTGMPLTFSGFANFTWPKGLDGFGSKTAKEFLTRNQLSLDIGQLMAGKPKWIEVWAGWQYWSNKFGNNTDLFIPNVGFVNRGATESQFLAGLTWHVF